jgi:hypothetical protein
MSKKYVAPAKRVVEQAAGLSKDELESEKLFPTLCEAGRTTWTGRTFKTTIDNLIASEKLTAQEKKLKEEALKAMEGWVRLSLKLTKADCLRFNELTERTARLAKEMEDPWYYKPTPYKYYPNDDEVSVLSFSEDEDST